MSEQNALEQCMDRVLAEFLTGLPSMVKEQLGNNVAEILGFKRWGRRWEVDTHNKESLIKQLVGERTRAVARECVAKQSWSPTKGQLEAIAIEFERSFSYDVSTAIRELSREMASKIKEQVAKRVSEEIDKMLPKLTMQNISDPGFMSTMPRFRDVIVEGLVSGTTKPVPVNTTKV